MRLSFYLLVSFNCFYGSDCPTKPPKKQSGDGLVIHSNGARSYNPYWVPAYKHIKNIEDMATYQKSIDKIETDKEKQYVALNLCITQKLNQEPEWDLYEKRMTKVYINGRPIPKLVYVRK